MKIIDKDSGQVYYDTGQGQVYKVASNFWERLKNDKIKFRGGGRAWPLAIDGNLY